MFGMILVKMLCVHINAGRWNCPANLIVSDDWLCLAEIVFV